LQTGISDAGCVMDAALSPVADLTDFVQLHLQILVSLAGGLGVFIGSYWIKL